MDNWRYLYASFSLDDDAKTWKDVLSGKESYALVDLLNEYGSEGWELVAVSPDSGFSYSTTETTASQTSGLVQTSGSVSSDIVMAHGYCAFFKKRSS